MKIVLLFFLTFGLVSALNNCRGHLRLKSIIDNVNFLKESSPEVFVKNVITKQCTLENFCQAKMVLSAYRAKELGLRKKDWRIPRHLAAYTRNVNCISDSSSADEIHFYQLLQNIKSCAQAHLRKPCNQLEQ